MKKLSLTMILIFSLSLFLCSAASADVITALATEINPEHLEKTASYARILGYNEESNTLTVELIVPEVFDREDVLSLQVGDSIYTGGQEIVIRTIEENEAGTIIINEGEYQYADGSVYLFEDFYGNYRPERYANYIWLSLGVIECPVQDSLLFLDYIDEEAAGDALTLPRVYTAQELKNKLLAEQASDEYFIGLAIDMSSFAVLCKPSSAMRRSSYSFSPGRRPVNSILMSTPGCSPESLMRLRAKSTIFTGSPMSKTNISPPFAYTAA